MNYLKLKVENLVVKPDADKGSNINEPKVLINFTNYDIDELLGQLIDEFGGDEIFKRLNHLIDLNNAKTLIIGSLGSENIKSSIPKDIAMVEYKDKEYLSSTTKQKQCTKHHYERHENKNGYVVNIDWICKCGRKITD